jgi:hypothetical protein
MLNHMGQALRLPLLLFLLLLAPLVAMRKTIPLLVSPATALTIYAAAS